MATLTRSSDETSFIVAYVNCALEVNANEVFTDQLMMLSNSFFVSINKISQLCDC